MLPPPPPPPLLLPLLLLPLLLLLKDAFTPQIRDRLGRAAQGRGRHHGDDAQARRMLLLHVTRRMACVLRRTSYVTRHTSHATRHPSHVTRHTSHITASTLASQTFTGKPPAHRCIHQMQTNFKPRPPPLNPQPPPPPHSSSAAAARGWM